MLETASNVHVQQVYFVNFRLPQKSCLYRHGQISSSWTY